MLKKSGFVQVRNDIIESPVRRKDESLRMELRNPDDDRVGGEGEGEGGDNEDGSDAILC